MVEVVVDGVGGFDEGLSLLAAFLPVFRLRSKRGKLLLETSSRILWPLRKTLLVDQRSILYS